jgi:hypothetical protein
MSRTASVDTSVDDPSRESATLVFPDTSEDEVFEEWHRGRKHGEASVVSSVSKYVISIRSVDVARQADST